MKREHNIIKNTDWVLLSNCPFDGNLYDISGNGNNCSLISGSDYYITVNGKTYLNCNTSGIIRFTNPLQSSYINNFLITLDFIIINNINYGMALDGFDNPSRYKGIKIGSSWGTQIGFGVGYGSQSVNDCVKGLAINKSDLFYNTEYHVVISNYQNTVDVTVEDTSNGTIYHNTDTCPIITPSEISYEYVQIGTNARYNNSRRFIGYLSNFKLYQHV